MFESFSMDLVRRKLTVEAGRVVARASGMALMHYGDTVVPSTTTASSKPREGIDFFPLNVEYEEKLCLAGKIPGSFNKKEGKASENAVLTCRVINRPMRPLFPEDYRNDMTPDNIAICVDLDCNPRLTAMLGSAIATSIPDIPFAGPCAATQVGLIGDQFIINPTANQKQVSDMALIVASTREKVIVVEADTNEALEQIMIDAIFRAHEVNQEIIRFIDTIMAECGKEKHSHESCAVPEELFAAIRGIVTPQEMEEAAFANDKQTYEKNMAEITAKLEETFVRNEEWLAVLDEAVCRYQKKTVRKVTLENHKRPDGRAITGIRHLAAEVDLLPKVHGSGVFIRDQTQVLDVCTLAPLSEAQKLDGLDENETNKRYMHRYGFSSFSVDEMKPSRGPGRREIDHGVLAEGVLILVLLSAEEFLYAIRTVSETMESSGSIFQTSICASTLSLIAAGVSTGKMVAGISYSLVTGDTDDDYLVLTDIQGLGDFFSDMDFKVGGVKNGITAVWMDIKIHGLTRPTIEEVITRTRGARMHILDSIMRPVISEPGKYLSPYTPKIEQITIDPQKIGDMVGKRDKVINEIIEETGVKINTVDDGPVNACGTNEAMTDRAIQIITGVVTDIEADMVSNGEVVRIMNLGTFVELVPNKDGTTHISKLSDKHVSKVEDVVNIGDEVTVEVTEVNKMGRINLTVRLSDLTEDKTAVKTEEK